MFLRNPVRSAFPWGVVIQQPYRAAESIGILMELVLSIDGADANHLGCVRNQIQVHKGKITRLVEFDLAPGFVPGQPTFHAGLAFFCITYDDGSLGVLVVGCHPPGSPPPVPEGSVRPRAS